MESMEKCRRKKDAQLRWKYKIKGIKNGILEEEVVLLSPLDGARRSMEREDSIMLLRPPSKRGFRSVSRTNRRWNMARIKARRNQRKSS